VGTRSEQREETRGRIVAAAAKAFSEKGFRAASTRDIAAEAGVNQGLLTYYFRNKQELWKEAASGIFERLASALGRPLDDDAGDLRAFARERIREYVRFVAAHPELFRLMVEEGKHADARMRWLVDTHLKPAYAGFERLAALNPNIDPAMIPHAFYTLAGGASMIFALQPECRRLTGLDPSRKPAIEAHANFIADLFVP
jgi:TetR/AcrR family transcriptional regulator